MKAIIELKDMLTMMRRTMRRYIISIQMRHCMYDLAHIEQTRRNDFIAERLRHRQLVALQAMLRELDTAAHDSRRVR
jgi:hypothetical protein